MASKKKKPNWKAVELSAMGAQLKEHGYRAADAARLRRLGILGPYDLEHRLRTGNLELTHGLKRKRKKERPMASRKKLHGAALKAHEKKLGKRSKKRKGEHHKKKKAHHRRRACAFCGHTAVHHAKQGCLHHSGMKFCSCKHRG
jgi:hypothetical protein